MGKDVVHHILALSIVVQKHGGQPIHLTVMLSELDLSYTLNTHENRFSKPLMAIFCAKLGKTHEKALGKGGKVGGEGESLNKCSGFGAILFIRAGGCDVYRLVGRLRCAGS